MNLELWQIAAAMLQAKIFISDNEEDHTKRTPKRIIQAAQQQREQLRNVIGEARADNAAPHPPKTL